MSSRAGFVMVMWWLGRLTEWMRSIRRLLKMRPALMTFEKNVNFPTRDWSCVCVHVLWVHHLCIWLVTSLILSAGMDMMNFSVSMLMPRKGSCLAGPNNLSSAMGMLSLLNVSLKVSSWRRANDMMGQLNIRKSSE